MVSIIDEWWLRLLYGLIGSTAIGFIAYKLRSLSISGMISAIILGTGYVLFGEPIWFSLLILFFVSSSLWSKWKKATRIKRKAETLYAKGGQRDAGQVWANGGLGLLLCIMYALTDQQWLLYGFLGVMAAVTADTWATEIGSISKQNPISIVSGRKVEPGTSGGITVLGIVASIGGGFVIGAVGYMVYSQTDNLNMLWIGALAGLIGSLVDSFIGAKWQAMYRCQKCNSQTEREKHCGQTTKAIYGLSWLTNDRVNLISSVIAGGLAAILFTIG